MAEDFKVEKYDTGGYRLRSVILKNISGEIKAISFKGLRAGAGWKPPTVNWSSIGGVDVETARRFAQGILEACRLAEEELTAPPAAHPE